MVEWNDRSEGHRANAFANHIPVALHVRPYIQVPRCEKRHGPVYTFLPRGCLSLLTLAFDPDLHYTSLKPANLNISLSLVSVS